MSILVSFKTWAVNKKIQIKIFQQLIISLIILELTGKVKSFYNFNNQTLLDNWRPWFINQAIPPFHQPLNKSASPRST